MRRILAVLLILILNSFTNISFTNSAVKSTFQTNTITGTIKMDQLKQSIGQEYLMSKHGIITNNIPNCLPIDTLGYNRITDTYGPRAKHPVRGIKAFHYGIDFAGKRNTKIYPSASGVVREVKYSSSYGNYIVVDHLNGITTLYAHLNKVLVKVDDIVIQDLPIGLMGSTGISTGPHLHFEVKVNGVHINPKLLLTDRKTISFKKISNLYLSNKLDYDHGKNRRIFSRKFDFQRLTASTGDISSTRLVK